MNGEPALWALALTLLLLGCCADRDLPQAEGRHAPPQLDRRLAHLKTMRNDDAWHAAHTATAGMVAGAGILQLVAGAALVVLQPSEDLMLAIVVGSGGLTLALVISRGGPWPPARRAGQPGTRHTPSA